MTPVAVTHDPVAVTHSPVSVTLHAVFIIKFINLNQLKQIKQLIK